MEEKDSLVNRLEANPKLSWALRAYILHNQGYSNSHSHGSWHPGPGVATWTPKKPKKKS